MLTSYWRRGFTILESLAVLTVLISLLSLGAHYVHQRQEAIRNRLVAEQLRTVTVYASRYVQEHYEELLKKSKTEHVDLQKKELLDVLEKENSFRQQYAAFILPQSSELPSITGKSPTRLELLIITTGGQEIKEPLLRRIAAQLGQQGGYVSKTDSSITTANSRIKTGNNHVIGIRDAWKIPTNRLSSAWRNAYIKPGHLASYSYLYADDVMQTRNLLHRRPSTSSATEDKTLHSMETDLLMQNHAIKFGDNNNKAAPTAKISANAMRLKRGEKTVSLSCKDKEGAQIKVEGTSGSKVTISPDRVTISDKKWRETWNGQQVTNYSGSELHAHWNKVPYYELSAGSDSDSDSDSHNGSNVLKKFAASLCSRDLSQANHEDFNQSPARLFMLGIEKQEFYELYVCLNGYPPQRIWYYPEKTQPTATKSAKKPSARPAK